MNVVPVTRRVDDQHTRDNRVFVHGGSTYESAEEENRMVVSGDRIGSGLRLGAWGGGPRVHWVGGLHESAGSGDLLSGSGDAMPRLLDEVPPHGYKVPGGCNDMPGDSNGLPGGRDSMSRVRDEVPGGGHGVPCECDCLPGI